MTLWLVSSTLITDLETRPQKYDAVDQNPNGFRPNTLKVVRSEREIFQLLELPYVSTFMRNYRFS